MKRPAIFFDRDNTLIVSDGYLGDPAQVRLVEGAAEAVAKARQLGFVCVTVSNQSGVARGMFDEEAVALVNQRVDQLLQGIKPSAVIARHEYCPFHPEGTVERYRQESELRKPKPGMILSAAEKLNLDLSRSWVIGDAPRDIEAGKAAGCRTILFVDRALAASPAAGEKPGIVADFTVGTLREAMEIIGREAFLKLGERAKVLSNHGPAGNDGAAGSAASGAAGGGVTNAGEGSGEGPGAVAGAPSLEEAAKVESATAVGNRKGIVPPGPVMREVQGGQGIQGVGCAGNAGGIQAKPAGVREVEMSAGASDVLTQILRELRQQREARERDFSISKLVAGVVQAGAAALMVVAFVRRDRGDAQLILLFALTLQVLTLTLLVMGRQR